MNHHYFSNKFLLFIFFLTAQIGFSQVRVWTRISIPSSRDFFEIEQFNDSTLLLPGDSGLVALRSKNNLWSLIQSSSRKPMVAAEAIQFENIGRKNKIIASDSKVFSLSETGTGLLPDSLPAYPLPNRIVKKVIDLNISNINETRYGIICDSARIMGYKFPYITPRFNIALSTKKEIQDLYPFNSWNILAIGDSGKIWKTAGLNNAFLPVIHGLTTNRLNKIIGKQDNKIWIAGDSGLVLYSQNSGQSWNKIAAPTSKNIYGGSIVDSTLWLCGEGGLILYSADEGQNWIEENNASNEDLLDIRAFKNEVLACGRNGTILQLNRLLSKKEQQKSDLFVLQNDGRNISLNNLSDQKLELKLVSIEGKQLLSSSLDRLSKLDLNHTKPGIYILFIQSEGIAPQFRKVIVQE